MSADPRPSEWFHCLRCDRDVPASEVTEQAWMPGKTGTFHTCGDYAHPPWEPAHSDHSVRPITGGSGVETPAPAPVSGSSGRCSGASVTDIGDHTPACYECGNDLGPYDGLCLDCLEETT